MIKQTKVMKSIKKSRKIAKKAYKILDAPGLTDNPSTDILDWSKKKHNRHKPDRKRLFLPKTKKQKQSIKSNRKAAQHLHISKIQSLRRHPSLRRQQRQPRHIQHPNQKKNLFTLSPQRSNNLNNLQIRKHPLNRLSRQINKILRSPLKKIIHHHKKHKQEIIRLKWDNQGSYLASSGNDNLIYIWDARKDEPIRCYSEHRGAVRGLAWAPNCFGSFVSGDDGVDGCVKFWNVNKKKSLKSVDTGERVFNLGFGGGNGFVSTHGGKGNRIMVWDNGVRERICVMDGHFMRVLHLAVGPGGEDVITAAGDETLKFWKVFHREKKEIIQPTCFSHYLKDLR